MARGGAPDFASLLAAPPSAASFAAVCRHIDRGLHRDPERQGAALEEAEIALARWPSEARVATAQALARLAAGTERPADRLARHLELRRATSADASLLADLPPIFLSAAVWTDDFADGAGLVDALGAAGDGGVASRIARLELAFGYRSIERWNPILESPGWDALEGLSLGRSHAPLTDPLGGKAALVSGVRSLSLVDASRQADAPVVSVHVLDALLLGAERLEVFRAGRVPREGVAALTGLVDGTGLREFRAAWPVRDVDLGRWSRLGSALEVLELSATAIGTDGGAALAALLSRTPRLSSLSLESRACGVSTLVGAVVEARRGGHLPALEHVSLVGGGGAEGDGAWSDAADASLGSLHHVRVVPCPGASPWSPNPKRD